MFSGFGSSVAAGAIPTIICKNKDTFDYLNTRKTALSIDSKVKIQYE